MKIYLPIVCCLLLFMGSCKNSSSGASNDAEVHLVNDGHFSIAFPDSVSVYTETQTTQTGDFKQITYMSKSGDDKVYSLTSSKFPDSLIQKDNVSSLLETAKEQALIKCGMSTGIEENQIEIEGYPGIWFKTKKDMDSVVYYTEYKMYFVENTFYQMGVMKKNEWPDESEVKSFWESFKLEH